MDLTITDNPAVTLQQVAWTVIDHYGKPVRLMLPNRSRCWSYFTKSAACVLAEHTYGQLHVTRTRSIKNVVTEIPAEVTESLITRRQGATKIETSLTFNVKEDGDSLFVSLSAEGDYADEEVNRTFYSIPELPPPGLTWRKFWGGLIAPLGHMLLAAEEEEK